MLVLIERIDDEGVAQMENRLLAKPEFTDSRMIGRLAAHAERKDVAPVILTKLPVVDDQEPRFLEKRVLGFGPAAPTVEAEAARSCIVGVLQKFLEDREAGIVTVLQVALDLIDD